MKDKVTILMATYNGAKFIEEQIDSIINQRYTNWKLIIRDDKSSDDTIEIIKRYCTKDSRITYVLSESNMGQTRNFNELLKLAIDSDYIMFADQDDVWKNDKIDITLEKMKSLEKIKGKDCPILVYTKLTYVNEKLEPINIKNANAGNEDLKTLLGYNFIWGCTMMLNKALRDISYPIGDKAQNHDYWIALSAALYGGIVRIDKETMLYRQHTNNVTGGVNNNSIIKKMKNIKKLINSYTKQIEQNLQFCEVNKNCNNKLLKEYSEIFKDRGIRVVFKASKFGLKRHTKKETLIYNISLAMLNMKSKEVENV